MKTWQRKLKKTPVISDWWCSQTAWVELGKYIDTLTVVYVRKLKYLTKILSLTGFPCNRKRKKGWAAGLSAFFFIFAARK